MYPVIGGSADVPFQTGIFKRLETDTVLFQMAKGGIYDTEVPASVNDGRGASFPYVVIAPATEIPADRLTTTANRVSVPIDIFSTYHGMLEANLIANRIMLLLHHQHRNLQVPGWILNQIILENKQGFREMDGMKHVQLRFGGLLQPIPTMVG